MMRFVVSGTVLFLALAGLMEMAVPSDGSPAKMLKLIMVAHEAHPPGTPELIRWIHELNDVHRATVDKAAQRIIAAGDGATQGIKLALAGETTLPERRRLQVILARIAKVDARRGPLVTLKLQNASLLTVISRLCKQGGITPNFYPSFTSGAPIPRYFNLLTLSINVWREPFWRVMRHLTRITGAEPAPINFTSPQLEFIAPKSTTSNMYATPPVALSGSKSLKILRRGIVSNPMVFREGTLFDDTGAFLIVIEPPTTNDVNLQSGAPRFIHRNLKSHIAYSSQPVSPELVNSDRRISIPPREFQRNAVVSLSMIVLWCPGRNWLTHVASPKLFQAVDNKGQSLLGLKQPGGEYNAYWGRGAQQIMFNVDVRLKRPSPGANVISILRGRIPVVLSYGAHYYKLTDMAAGEASCHICGFRLSFGKPQQQGVSWRLPFTIETPMMGSRKSLLISQFTAMYSLGWGPNLILKDKADRILTFSGGAFGTGAAAYYHWDLSVQGKPTAARLLMYTYLKKRMYIPFEFRNVPIRDLHDVAVGNGN
jgi:hypothetical protein